ncbi:MAG: M15 family metallopeptidase [Clostridia bacterium]|nr:M15 family metallopeptidase [Clostridia bacterium]
MISRMIILMVLVLSLCSFSGLADAEIDYLALVNKLHPLPEGWEESLETVTITNSVGDEVEVEAKAYASYEMLRSDLEKNDDIYIELDSARRSVAAQQDIMDRFIEKYGADYAAKTVATPGYSEHHTGLALDLYFRIKNDDGTFTDVYYNEDMTKPEYEGLWDKIHGKLADYGFILRYLKDKEYITGYGYEPWHIRYIDDTDLAKTIMDQPGMTLEVWLGAATDANVTIQYGNSELFTLEELEEAAVQVKCKFATFAGCELHTLRYAGDECNTEENIAWMNRLDEGQEYIQAVEFVSDFHSPVQPTDETAWDLDAEYTDFQWWLARTADGGWQLLTWGYGGADALQE